MSKWTLFNLVIRDLSYPPTVIGLLFLEQSSRPQLKLVFHQASTTEFQKGGKFVQLSLLCRRNPENGDKRTVCQQQRNLFNLRSEANVPCIVERFISEFSEKKLKKIIMSARFIFAPCARMIGARAAQRENGKLNRLANEPAKSTRQVGCGQLRAQLNMRILCNKVQYGWLALKLLFTLGHVIGHHTSPHTSTKS
ncbi:hypothetical protein T265_01289 [Opisthorchis viverrini]|uniref:Uncharacterized protein n=1 Tax=Opisthorchis viverrini TaxID=6198 RepID=A0A074ZYR2_OPIVI|nr:hypothetical protein T265_01289 [Opisthorchis viverrini]KER32598.1 hypothetical protein T265_01289 [Opisthorchis viverrini]